MDEAPIIRVSENQIPDDLSVTFLKAKDGGRIRFATLPQGGAAKGTILVHPGWSEFLEKYIEVATDLRREGYDVALCDPRGQGYSQRVVAGDNRGLILDFDQFTEDMDVIIENMMAKFPPPYFIMAHSMGGLITLQWLASRRPDQIEGAVLCAPLTRVFAHPVKRFIVRNIVRAGVMLGGAKRHILAAPEHSMNFETNTLTQDQRRHARFKRLQEAAPEAQAGVPRFGWLNAALAATVRISEPGALDGLPCPVLLVSADRDETVDPTHHHVLAAQYEKIRLKTIPDARHELMMERDDYRGEFFAYADEFLNERLSAYTARMTVPPSDSMTSPDNTRSSTPSES